MVDVVDIAQEDLVGFSDWLVKSRRQRQKLRHSRCRCEKCGEIIPAARRHAVPGVKLCVDCQEEVERGNR